MTKRSPEKSPEKITLEEAQSALRRSGYLVEARIARLLKGRCVGDRRYAVYPNWGYEDRVTGKTRELDIYAELVVSPVSSWINFMTHSLIIECVNNPQPLVMFTSGTGSSALMMDHEILKWRTQASLVPFAADGSGGRQPLCQLLDAPSYHHYFDTPYATQYCSFQRKGKGHDAEWMAFHDDSHFESFGKLCDMVDVQLALYDRTRDDDPGFDEPTRLLTYFPILVVQGDLYQLVAGTDGTLVESGHLVYETTRVVRDRRRVYRIDVVTENSFRSFIERLEAGTRETANRLAANEALVRIGADEWVRAKKAERRKRWKREVVQRLSPMGEPGSETAT